jgi:hypothetical protein
MPIVSCVSWWCAFPALPSLRLPCADSCAPGVWCGCAGKVRIHQFRGEEDPNVRVTELSEGEAGYIQQGTSPRGGRGMSLFMCIAHRMHARCRWLPFDPAPQSRCLMLSAVPRMVLACRRVPPGGEHQQGHLPVPADL